MGEVSALSEKLNCEVIPADATSVEDLENVFKRSMEVLGLSLIHICLKNSGLAYVVKDGAIAIRPANEVNAVKAVEQANVISGTVVDAVSYTHLPIDHTAMAHKYPFFVPIQSMKRPANRLPKA